MAQEQQQINGVDMEAYEDFKKRHATRTPTEFAKVMHRTDPEHGFELEWWSDDPDIVEWFSTIIDDATDISLTRGFHEYTKMADGSLRAEDIIRRCSPENGMGDPFKIDTKEQLLQLIKETFKL